MFEELIKINRNGYSDRRKRTFPQIAEIMIRSAKLIFKPLLMFSIFSILIGLTLSYLALILDFSKTLLGKWVITYVIFLLLAPSVILLTFCYQLSRMIHVVEGMIRRSQYQPFPPKKKRGKLNSLFVAFKTINRYMIHYKHTIKELSKLRLLTQPLFYYLVVVSFSLQMAYIGVALVVAFGSGVWFFLHP